ncbi:alpha/beta hydrolase [Microbacterium amylolyticum]|uniref:Alpha-beta hydrolase superfamily lysophospholipase n=1 Tax=Microbacterium amylolyticum TaxID=936337 RepID=A0ABS4ZHF5_9MICO|nr:alpha/beta fold hydrolase [Microbacterium amylolyticum]MBP2436637.1 alpha-beta hydrolase superfamily lysophospholipase [Microbacterium amylolyticum]
MPEFIDRHGVTIFYDRYEPAGSPRGIAQILHGVGEHAGRYRALIDELTANGWIVYADDHRGHGRTGMKQYGTVDRAFRLGPGGHRGAEDAIWQLTQIARDEHPELPLVLIAHSWGSFLAQILLNSHPGAYDAAVLVGTALRWPGSLTATPLNARWNTPDARGNEWISEDVDVQIAALEDPLASQMPLAIALGPASGLRIYGRPARGLREMAGIDVPILLMVGRDDPVGGPVSVHRLADAYRKRSGFSDVTTHVYDGRHEILNGFQQEQVRADLLGWLGQRF